MTLLHKITHRPCCEQFHVDKKVVLVSMEADISKTGQLTPKLSISINSTTGKRKTTFDDGVNCPFKPGELSFLASVLLKKYPEEN